ncbi:tripartite-type tricarboxylate transporter receptor subunit TctC [Bradyrhizobium sp. AZCC 2262]|uniref:Bug family tripartite tricarboxylate transporter substrate binding protein n=1 Tax=Bradyrhizobium sp. AZCC 2262 TaxID=3117022 RepID=UPI002FF02258
MSRLPHRFVWLIAWLSMISLAQAYPDRPVRLIVPFAAGGGTDAMTRILADRLQQRLGPRFLVENVTGAAGNAGADRASHAPPDGYTLLIGSMGVLTVNPWIYTSTGTAILDRLVPVSMIFDTGHIFVVNPALKATSLGEVAELARTSEKPLTFASAGMGTSTHLYAELFRLAAKAPMTHVPYRGNGPALTDVVAGHVQIMFDQIASASGQAKSGSVRPLAVTTKQRLSFLPNVPTAAEAGYPQLMGTSWTALMAPKDAPPDIIAVLGRTLTEIAAEPETREKIEALGANILTSTPQEAGEIIARELERWRPVVKAAGIPEN